MHIFVLGSGSSGNCLVAQAEGQCLVLEAGMGPARVRAGMVALGGPDLVMPRVPIGILLTHEHGDHSGHAASLSRALKAPLLAHERMPLPLPAQEYSPGRPFEIGPFLVETLALPHDAPHVAVRVTAGAHRFALATDLGRVPRDLRTFLGACDLVLLEANYCPSMLESGPYPAHLKRRVGGPLGHLANSQAAELAASLVDTRVSHLVLVHLSRANNTPERAIDCVASKARRLSVEVLPQGVSRAFDVRRAHSRSRSTGAARGAAAARAEQLTFGFGSAF